MVTKFQGNPPLLLSLRSISAQITHTYYVKNESKNEYNNQSRSKNINKNKNENKKQES